MTHSEKNNLIIAATFVFCGIILGAFGAHVLKEILSEKALESFKTGVFYQISQGIGLFIMIVIGKLFNTNFNIAKRLLTTGIILFSVSIYLLSGFENQNLGIFKKILGPITPIGGLLMIFSWLIFIIKVIKTPKNL